MQGPGSFAGGNSSAVVGGRCSRQGCKDRVECRLMSSTPTNTSLFACKVPETILLEVYLLEGG